MERKGTKTSEEGRGILVYEMVRNKRVHRSGTRRGDGRGTLRGRVGRVEIAEAELDEELGFPKLGRGGREEDE